MKMIKQIIMNIVILFLFTLIIAIAMFLWGIEKVPDVGNLRLFGGWTVLHSGCAMLANTIYSNKN